MGEQISVRSSVEILREHFPPEVLLTDPGTVRTLSRDQSHWELDTADADAVIRARDEDDASLLLRLANEHGFTVIVRGGGSGLSGGASAIPGAVILDVSAMDQIVEIDEVERIAVVEPGVITSVLDAQAAERGLMFAPDPASAALSTVGGNIATNAGGLRCIKYGNTRDAVLGLRVVLPSGEIIDLGGRTRKNVTGLDLTRLMVGSEGTLGVVVRATVRLLPRPAAVRTLVAWCADPESAQRTVIAGLSAGVTPSMFELMDEDVLGPAGRELTAQLVTEPNPGGVLLIVQADGSDPDLEIEQLARAMESTSAVEILGDFDGERVMILRRKGDVPGVSDPQVGGGPDEWWLGEDMTLPLRHLAEYMRFSERVAEETGVRISLLSHVGDGNLHPSLRLPHATHTTAEAERQLHDAADRLVRFALSHGGALSGEHGVGIAKTRWLPLALSEPVRALHTNVKEVFDPHGVLGPGRAY